jgi:hypothetical protein
MIHRISAEYFGASIVSRPAYIAANSNAKTKMGQEANDEINVVNLQFPFDRSSYFPPWGHAHREYL